MVVFLLRLVAQTITLTVNFMTTFTFSQQFNQRWSDSPTTVRQAITQELEDIITLLQPDTKLDEFAFTNDQLATHIDALYEEDRQQNKTLDIQTVDIQPTVRSKHSSTADQQMAIDLEAAQPEATQMATEATTNVADLLANAPTELNSEYNDEVEYSESTHMDTHTDGAINNDINETRIDSTDDMTADGTPSSEPDTDSILQQLEQHIDDIIHDELDTLASNLKLWLRDEVSKRLGMLD